MLSCQVKITTCHNYFSHQTSVFVELTEYWIQVFISLIICHFHKKLSVWRKIVVLLDIGLVSDWNEQFCRRYNRFKKVTLMLMSDCHERDTTTPPHIHTSKQTLALLVAWRQKMMFGRNNFINGNKDGEEKKIELTSFKKFVVTQKSTYIFPFPPSLAD